jgi:hypothetical protein
MTEKTDCNTAEGLQLGLCVLGQALAVLCFGHAGLYCTADVY